MALKVEGALRQAMRAPPTAEIDPWLTVSKEMGTSYNHRELNFANNLSEFKRIFFLRASRKECSLDHALIQPGLPPTENPVTSCLNFRPTEFCDNEYCFKLLSLW